MKNPHYQNIEFDVIVIGAGIAGIYLLHRLREVGFTVLAVEAASDVWGVAADTIELRQGALWHGDQFLTYPDLFIRYFGLAGGEFIGQG